MTKPRKLHELKGTIKHCFLGKVSNKGPHKNQPFYYLEISTQNLFAEKSKAILYAFPNLVPKGLWKALEQQSFKGKTYLFTYEKRVRGWRLKDWKEIPN